MTVHPDAKPGVYVPLHTAAAAWPAIVLAASSNFFEKVMVGAARIERATSPM
jgi:hypothetical protein